MLSLLALASAQASQTRHFVLDTPQALAGATGRGVAVFPDGSLRPLPPLAQVAAFDEPLGLALAVAPDGTAFVGTGHPARIYRVRDGKKELVGEVKADQITALLLDPSGTLWATTAAPALLLRAARGGRHRTGGGAARGQPLGPRLVPGRPRRRGRQPGPAHAPRREGARDGRGDPRPPRPLSRGERRPAARRHLRQGARDALDRATAPPGVVYDSAFTEIAALAPAPDGATYAAALTGDPTLGKPPAKEEGEARRDGVR